MGGRQCDGKCAYGETICAKRGECCRAVAEDAIRTLFEIIEDKQAAKVLVYPIASLSDYTQGRLKPSVGEQIDQLAKERENAG